MLGNLRGEEGRRDGLFEGNAARGLIVTADNLGIERGPVARSGGLATLPEGAVIGIVGSGSN